ncbi:MAG: hypothetical protein R3C24_13950 [Cyanobacteriota/Melainabacteria group bacterium]
MSAAKAIIRLWQLPEPVQAQPWSARSAKTLWRAILETEKNGVDISAMSIDPTSGSGLANIYVDPDGDNSIIIVPQPM